MKGISFGEIRQMAFGKPGHHGPAIGEPDEFPD
jgi:hypothetical protein